MGGYALLQHIQNREQNQLVVFHLEGIRYIGNDERCFVEDNEGNNYGP